MTSLSFSIITTVRNRVDSIERSMYSVISQNYPNLEYVLIDGASTDGTSETIEGIIKNQRSIDELTRRKYVFVSEADCGIYDGINKGIQVSSGDIIGLMHSDDVYASSDILSEVEMEFLKDPLIDIVYGDALYYSKKDSTKPKRYYSSSRFSPKSLAWGWIPCHTTMFMRRTVFDRFGFYKTNYKIAADVEYIARIFQGNFLKYSYIAKPLIHMDIGGVSTSGLKSKIVLNLEFVRALRENDIKTNIFKILTKYPLKLLELINV